jgi:hypothetical protein
MWAHFAWLTLAMLVAMSFPIAWMISSKLIEGSYLGFFSNQVSMNTENLEGSAMSRYRFFIDGMQYQVGALWGWFIGGLICAGVAIWKRPALAGPIVLLPFYVFILMTVVAVKGSGVSQERYTLSVIAALAPFAGWVFAEFTRALTQWHGRPAGDVPTSTDRSPKKAKLLAAMGVVGLLIAASTTYHFVRECSYHHRHFPKWGYYTESMVSGYLLAQELQQPQLLPGLAKEGQVVIWRPDFPTDDHILQQAMMSGWTWRYFHLQEREFPEWLAQENTTVVRFGEPIAEPPARFVPVVTFPWMTIYHDSVALESAGRLPPR